MKFLATAIMTLSTLATAQAGGPYQATGIKIGEVTTNSAIVWTRLTAAPARVGMDVPMPTSVYKDPNSDTTRKEPPSRITDWEAIVNFPEGTTIDTIQGAVPAAEGSVRVRYRAADDESWRGTDWTAVKLENDATRQFTLEDLKAGTRYNVTVEARGAGGAITSEVAGGFITAPAADSAARVAFTVTTGQRYSDMDPPYTGFSFYDAMLRDRPDFFVHTGDILYYDVLAKTVPLARWHWQRTYSFATNVNFHRQVASYFMKDDHDTWQNDCWPTMGGRYMGDFTFEQGQAIFREQVPMGEKTYRTVRWGKDLQIWLPEGRDFRSPNTMEDGPAKTIWGKEQMDWFKRTVEASDATFRIVVNATPIVGPDRGKKNDNHANEGFTYEGDLLRAYIAAQKNMYVICGDRHWQYVSVDAKTGLREFSCGPASDKHAGGWKQEDERPEHQYLNVTGGYLGVVVEQVDGVPTATFTHYGVDGTPLHTEAHAAK